MSTSTEIQETLLKAIDAVITQRNNELKLDKTITATVLKNMGQRGNRPLYQVEYAGGVIEAVAQSVEDSYSPRSGVYVLIPEGDFSKEKIIIGRTSKTMTDRTSSVVAAATNQYSIVGPNLLKGKNGTNIKTLQFGLHSFHPASRDTTHGIEHRAQFLYNVENTNNQITFDEDRFNLYKEDTTAIMVKADFMTNLENIQKQQPGARYGLIFNFAFDNLNKGYGETNREIFENISQTIHGNLYWNDSEKPVNKTLYEIYHEVFLDKFDTVSDVDFWKADGTGILDQMINYTTVLYDAFKVDNEKADKEIFNHSVRAFLSLLSESKGAESVSDIAALFEKWSTEVVGDAAQKYEQFVLSSDDMIGNPFNFDTWNSQYAVFEIDLETYNHLESILFYKEGFFEDTEFTNYEAQWPIETDGGPDIFVKNIQIYAMNPLDSQSGDYTLKIEPYSDFDIIISKHPETGYLSTTQLKATFLRKLYEDLTANGKTSYLWFKEDPSVIRSSSDGYNYLGGLGWRKIDNNSKNNYLFTTTMEDNYAYKNNYKCVVIYEPSQDDKTILSYEFSVYNQDMALDLKLESDLGTNFSFDAGAPLITVLIDKDRNNDDEPFMEYGEEDLTKNPPYLYSWAIQDSTNSYVLFLDEVFEVLTTENTSVEEYKTIIAKKALLKNIKTYIKDIETTKTQRATRIKYPVSISSSGFTVTCYVKQRNEDGAYYDVGSASLGFRNKNDAITSNYRIHIVNGDQIFQYDEYGKNPGSKTSKDPLKIKPLQAKLFTPKGVEVSGTNYQVEWILPIDQTMISTTETLVRNPATNLIQSYKGYELNFDIAKLYDPNAYSNQITCHISFGGQDYYKDTNFYFGKQGSNGTNGTDTIAKIEYNGEDDPLRTLHYQPLTLYVQKAVEEKEQNGETAVVTGKGMLNIGSKELKDSIILGKTSLNSSTDGVTVTEEGVLKVSVYQKEELLNSSSYKIGYPRWNLAGNTNEAANQVSNYFNMTTSMDNVSSSNSALIWDYSIQDKIYRLQNIKATVVLKDLRNKREQYYYAFFSLPIIEYEPANIAVNALLNIDRISIDKEKYLNEIIYNQDGRNPIYNHNQGLRLYNIPSSITKIVWEAKGGLKAEENEPWFSLLEKKDTTNGVKIIETVPKDNASMIYVLPFDIFDGSATNNRIEAKLYNENQLVATVYAPINITLNTFGLTSLNDWDGNSVVINEDDENGYVMAPQIGAGTKDSNNRFSGILMGRTEAYTGGAENEEEIGLFGYAHGLQSIFLDSKTGDAFFGLPDVTAEIDDQTGDVKYRYKNTNRYTENNEDNYNEGRIELRPGDISKIGGWRLGRRSLYYITKFNRDLNSWVYSGEIGNKYEDEDAIHHIKDIKHEDQGILLSADPAYISIKGRPLTSTDVSSSTDSQIEVGDSIELQLDPLNVALFGIYKHHNDRRELLSGINTKGQLVANRMEQAPAEGSGTRTGLAIETIKAFDDNIINGEEKGYIGASFEAGKMISSVGGNALATEDFFDVFIGKDKAGQEDAHIYITGGQFKDSSNNKNDYSKEFSIHGKNSIGLFVTSSRSIEKTTDANIQIATNNAQINLGDSTQLYLNRSGQQANTLKTAGVFNWEVGTEIARQNLNINAAELTENYSKILTTNTGTYELKNTGTTTINSDDDIILKKGSDSYLKLTSNDIALSIPRKSNTDTDISNYLKIAQNGTHKWMTSNQNITIQTAGSINHLSLISDGASLSSDNPQSFNTSGGEAYSQVIIRAGKSSDHYTKILLASNVDNWNKVKTKGNNKSTIGGIRHVDGVPFTLAVRGAGDDRGSITIRHNFLEGKTTADTDDVGIYAFCSSMEVRAPSLVLTDAIYTESGGTNYSLWAEKSVYTKSKYYGNSSDAICDGSSQDVSGGSTKKLGNSFTIKAPKITLQANGRPKIEEGSTTFKYDLPTPGEIGAIPTSVYSPYNSLGAWVDARIPNVSDFAKLADLGLKVTCWTSNGQLNVEVSAFGKSDIGTCNLPSSKD